MPLQLHLALLVLLAAVVHASWNAVVKSSGDRFLTFTVIAFTGTVVGALAAFFVPLPAPQVWPYLILSAAVHNVYYVTLLLGYRYGDLSEVYPLARGSSPLIVLVLAAIFAAEVPQPMGLAGVALVSAGIISLAFAGSRLTRARMQGFTSASAWSPFYVSIVVILTVMPDLTLFAVVLPGLLTATGILASGYLFDRITRKPTDGSVARQPPVPLPRNQRGALVFIPLSLVGLIVTLHEGVGISIPAALGTVAPLYALVWYGVISGNAANWLPRSHDLAMRVLGVLPTMRSEILVFVGAYIFGTGIAGIIPGDLVAGFLDRMLPWIDLRLIVLIITVNLLGMAGLHPVVTVILAVQVLPPEVIGLRDWVFAAALMATWGLSTTVSPYSATTLFMARVSGVSNYTIAWRWNPPAIFFATLVVCTLIVSVRHLTL